MFMPPHRVGQCCSFLAASVSLCVAATMLAAEPRDPATSTMRVYVGTYTNKASKGIYSFDFDPVTGKATKPVLAAEVKHPPFLVIHPNGKFLYSVGELVQKREKGSSVFGAVNAFAIDPTSGKLTFLNQESSKGLGPCFVSLDRDGKFVLVANYASGDVAVLPIGEDGRLLPATASVRHRGSSINANRQTGPHAHSITVDPSGRFVLAADLGVDKVFIYKFNDKRGALEPNNPPAAAVHAGSGPRHLAFHSSGKFAYAINELLSTVTAFIWSSDIGELTQIETVSTLPKGLSVPGNTTAEVLVHPSGKYLYGSNRGHDSIAMFVIDEQTGRLTPMGHVSSGGKTPRNFRIDPTGAWLLAANQDSDTIHVFRIDQKTGKLEATGQVIEVPTPVCLKFYEAPQ